MKAGRATDRVSCASTSTTRHHGRLQLPIGSDLDHRRPCGDAGVAGLPRADAGAFAGTRVLASAGVGGAGAGDLCAGVVGDVLPGPSPRRALDVPGFRPGAAANRAAVPDGGTGATGYRRGTRA